MTMLDEMVGTVVKNLVGGATQGGLMQQALSLVNNPETGGLAGLVQRFSNSGLDKVVSSWIGTGGNLPIEPQQVQQALGSQQINDLASRAGITPDAATRGLAEMLPQIIDKLTPDGNLPTNQMLEQGLSMLRQKFLGS